MGDLLCFHDYVCNPEEDDQNFYTWAHSQQEAAELFVKVMNDDDTDDKGEVRFDVILCPSGSSATSAGISMDYDEVIFVAEDQLP